MSKIKFTRDNASKILVICSNAKYGAYFGYDNKKDKMILNLEKLGRLCAKVVEGQELEYTDNRIQVLDENTCDG